MRTAGNCLHRPWSGFIVGMVALGWLLAAVGSANEWTCRVLELDPDPGTLRPPVVSAVALHPEGRFVAIAGDDHRIRIVDLESGRTLQRRAAHGDWVRSLVYAPTGKTLASAGNDGRIVLWDATHATELRQLASLPHPITAIAFSQTGKSLASIGFGDDLRVFDVDGQKSAVRFGCPCTDMRALAYSADLRMLASGGRSGVVRVWDVGTGKVVQEYTAHNKRVRGLAFSPDGKTLVSCGEDGRIQVKPISGQPGFMLESPGTKVMSLTYCGADRLATGGSDNLVRIWDLTRRVQVSQLSGHTGSVVTLAYGGNVLLSSGFDTTVRVWTNNGDSASAAASEDSPGPQGVSVPISAPLMDDAPQQDRVGVRWEPRSRIQQ